MTVVATHLEDVTGPENRRKQLQEMLDKIDQMALGLVGFARKVDDPTRASIPPVGDNPEAKFFATLEKFRFDDGSAFDFRGDAEHSANGRGGRLGNSNERSVKGFQATEELTRRFGPSGQYKLDWIFVRPDFGPQSDHGRLAAGRSGGSADYCGFPLKRF